MQKRLFMFCLFLFITKLIANDELKVKRENIFTFKSTPQVIGEKDNAKISFETNGYCDVTVVVEDDQGNIIRHLVSGVLGDNPPEPLQANTKSQIILWDYKDDAGVYIKNIEQLNVRVSLGLKPQFERSLFWSPEKRINKSVPALIQACTQGVLTFEGEGVDQLKLYSHSGEYIKMIYPFSNKNLNSIKALSFQTFPQEGKTLPIKFGNATFATFLKTGENGDNRTGNKYGQAASALVVHENKIGLIGKKLGILTLGEDFENIVLEGPNLALEVKYSETNAPVFKPEPPRSAAVSPDGKWIYLGGYINKNFVQRIAFHKDGVMECFLGNPDGKRGQSDKEFDGVASVACDSKGRVYVADYCNDRIQVFSDKGEFLKSIKTPQPNTVLIDPHNGDIYVASFLSLTSDYAKDCPKPELRHFGNFDNPEIKNISKLPLNHYQSSGGLNHGNWKSFKVHIDFYEKQPVIWLVPGWIGGWFHPSGEFANLDANKKPLEASCIKLLVAEDKSLKTFVDFGPKITASVVRILPPIISRQRLYVNPKNEKLYVGEGDSGVMKSFKELVEIEPNTGKVNIIKLPFPTEDLCFDYNGLIYLRTDTMVVRYDPQTWKEIPFDYGTEQEFVGFEVRKMNPSVISALQLPTCGKPGHFHLGGISINHKLNLAVSCYNAKFNLGVEQPGASDNKYKSAGKGLGQYKPENYPGRVNYAEIQIWDKQGKLLKEDAFPGLGITDGIAIDNDDNIYALADGARIIDGKIAFEKTSETLIKVKPNKSKILSDSNRADVPLPQASRPKRNPDIRSGSIGNAWVENAEWLYGGVGFAGFSVGYAPACACWNARFSVDYLKRSFAPEISHFSVAVLDSNGNLIMRIGQYGNVDDGMPLIKDGGPKNPISIGGDEVALFHAAYLTTLTDKKLFIADAGNSRILSVKLNYHEQKINPVKIPKLEK